MRVNITIRDLPRGGIDYEVKCHGGKRPGGHGAEAIANSIIKAIVAYKAVATKLAEDEKAKSQQPAVAEAVADHG